MTFDKQVKEAKIKKLESRIVRDLIFLILGVIFLLLSIFSSIKNKDNKIHENKKENIKTTIINK